MILTDDVTKARGISRQLPSYLVRCTFGNLEDFPRDELGIDIQKTFQPKMKIIKTKKSLLAELKRICTRASTICIATDISSEGEYRAWHIAKALRLDLNKTCRVPFTSLAEFCTVCKEATRNPRHSEYFFENRLIEAFQTRLVCNRLMEIQISPFISKLINSQVRMSGSHWPLLRCLVSNTNPEHKTFCRYEIKLQFAHGVQSSFEKYFATHQEGIDFLECISRTKFGVIRDTGLESTKVSPFTTYSLMKHVNYHRLFCRETASNISEALSRLHFNGKIYNKIVIEKPLASGTTTTTTTANKIERQQKNQQIHVTNINQTYIQENAPELDKLLYHFIWRNTMYSQSNDCSKRTLVLGTESLIIQSHISLSRSLDRNSVLFKDVVSKDDIRLTKLEAIVSNNCSRSANDIADFNCEAGCDGTMLCLDNWNMSRLDPLFVYEPTSEIRMSSADNFKVSQSAGKSYIRLSQDGRTAVQFLQKNFPQLLSREFQSKLQQKFMDVDLGKDVYPNVTAYLQDSVFPTVRRLRKGRDLSEPRAIRHPRILGSHPECGRQIKVVKARYGPCLMLGQSLDCYWFKISKIQYDTLDLDTALTLILRRQKAQTSSSCCPKETGQDQVIASKRSM